MDTAYFSKPFSWISALVLVAVVFLSFSPANAQTAVGIHLSPEINRSSNYFNDAPVHDFGATAGLHAQTGLSQRLSLVYGIHYASKRFDSNGYRSSIAVAGGSTLMNVNAVRSSFKHLEVPLQVRYGFGGSSAKLVPYVQAGVVGAWIVSATDRYTTQEGTALETKPSIADSRTNISGEAGVGIAYNLNESLQLNLQPTARFEFDSPVFISRIGVGMTIFYKF